MEAQAGESELQAALQKQQAAKADEQSCAQAIAKATAQARQFNMAREEALDQCRTEAEQAVEARATLACLEKAREKAGRRAEAVAEAARASQESAAAWCALGAGAGQVVEFDSSCCWCCSAGVRCCQGPSIL